MLMERIKKLFGRREIPREARDLLRDAKTPRELLRGLDELITRNEMEVNGVNREIEALEEVERREVERVRQGALPERSKNNALRSVQRIRKQMDNLEERQKIYNRNINLQISLVGRIQSLDAMEMRGVDESAIDQILAGYEEELSSYREVLETEDVLTADLSAALDDSNELRAIEAELLGTSSAVTSTTARGAAVPSIVDSVATPVPPVLAREPAPRVAAVATAAMSEKEQDL